MSKNRRHRLLIFSVAVFAFAVLLTSHAAADPAPLSGWGSATIDGVIQGSEWAGAATQDLSVNLPDGGGTTAGRYYVMNDESNIYVGLRLERPSLDWSMEAAQFSANDDNFFVRSDDVFIDNWQNKNDTQVGGTNDGSGAASNDGVYSYYEMAHPLDSADNAHDFSLAAGDTVGFRMFVRVCGMVTCGDTYDPAYPAFRDVLIAQSPSTLEEIYAALRPASLVTTTGETAFQQGDPVSFRYDLINTSSTEPLIVPVTDFYGTLYSVVGTQQSWIERRGPDPTIPAIPPIIAKKGTWYASGGLLLFVCLPPGGGGCPGYTIPAAGALERAALLLHSTEDFPSGFYRFHVEYKPVFNSGLYDVIAGVSLDFTIGSVDELLTAFHSAVEGLGPGKSLADKIESAQAAYADGDESGTCEILSAFINQVEAQSGKHIDTEVAEQLIADATAIIEAIGC